MGQAGARAPCNLNPEGLMEMVRFASTERTWACFNIKFELSSHGQSLVSSQKTLQAAL